MGEKPPKRLSFVATNHAHRLSDGIHTLVLELMRILLYQMFMKWRKKCYIRIMKSILYYRFASTFAIRWWFNVIIFSLILWIISFYLMSVLFYDLNCTNTISGRVRWPNHRLNKHFMVIIQSLCSWLIETHLWIYNINER